MRIVIRLALLGWALAVLSPGAHGQEPDSDGRILVMLALAPAHFRPDVDYPGGYDASVGQESRRRTARDLAQTYGLRLVDDWPMPALGVACFVMAVAQGASMESTVEHLRRDRLVESVQVMNQFRGLGRGDPLASLQPASNLWHLAQLHAIADGHGVSLAQIDSGVDRAHPDLAAQDIRTEDLVGDLTPEMGEAHGTQVAGIIVAQADNGVGIAGIAPGVRLLALRACWQVQQDSSLCNSFTLAKALQFAIDRKVRIINMSLTGPFDRLLERLLEVAWQRDIAVVAAADPDSGDGGFPASNDHVLGVGVLGTGGGSPADAQAWAPGRDVPTTTPGGRWEFVNGSSFAAAHVSALLALMLQLSPAWRPADLVGALLPPGARPVNAARRTRIGSIDACIALSRAAAGREVCREEAAPRVVSSH